jgi:hypothetical protein
MGYWSPKELTEANAIGARLRRHLHPRHAAKLDELFRSLMGNDEASARGAFFELRTLNRLKDEHLGEVELARPVSPGTRDNTDIDLYVPSLNLAVELKSRQHIIIPFMQDRLDPNPSPEYLQYWEEEFNSNVYYTSNITDDQASALLGEVETKCRDKRFALLTEPVWLLTDLSGTDWLTHYRTELPTPNDHLRELGMAFARLAMNSAMPSGADNCLVQCPWVYLAFLRGPDEGGEDLVIFARTDAERSAAPKLAAALQLPIRVVAL